MSKNFNLSIPKKRLRSARFKLGQYFSSAAFSGAALSLVLAGALILPQTVLSDEHTNANVSSGEGQPGCTLPPVRGTIDTDGDFTENAQGNDFQITCTGALSARLDNESIMSIDAAISNNPGFSVRTSKVLLVLTGETSESHGINFVSEVGLNILKGSLTNDADVTDGSAVSLMNGDNNAVLGINAENRADVTIEGAGRKAFTIYGVGGKNASFTNHGTITTSGDVYQRPSPTYEGDKSPNRRSDGVTVETYGASGHVEITNHGTVTIEGRAAKGLTGGVAGTDYNGDDLDNPSDGGVTINNYGTVTTTGDAHEFPLSTGYPNAEKINRDYKPYGVQAYINNEGIGNINITNKSGATITTTGRGSRIISAYSESSGEVNVVNEGADGETAAGTVTNEGGAWQASTSPYMSRPDGLYGNSGGGGAVVVTNRGSVTIGHAEDSAMANPEAIEMAVSNINERSLGDPVAQADLDAIGVSGTFGNALFAIAEGEDPGHAEVNNEGTITTWGYKAHGMRTWAQGGSEDSVHRAEGTNEASGMITTHGDNADGMLILAASSTHANSYVRATNKGTITVNGDSVVNNNVTNGISAGFWMDRDKDGIPYSNDADGTVTVTNSGTVEATGDGTTAIAAGFWAAQGNTIENSGDVIVNIEEGSTVTASGNNSTALYAQTHGSGNVDINVVNGNGDPEVVTKITAGTEDDPLTDEDERKFGYGIYAVANTDSSDDDEPSATTTDNDVDISIKGAITDGSVRNTTIQAYGAATDDPDTDIDETKGIAILADSGGMYDENGYAGTGRSNILIQDANVAGGADGSGYAVIFRGGPGTLTLDNSRLQGDIVFTDSADNLIIKDSRNIGDGCITDFDPDYQCSEIQGDIHFGDGDDVMAINAYEFKMDNIDITGRPTIKFNGDKFDDGNLTLQDVRFNVAGINFGTGRNHLNILVDKRNSSINGDIDFDYDPEKTGVTNADILTINVNDGMVFDLMGAITNLETMHKRGSGVARVNDVEFTASTLNLHNGKLIVSGHLNLGEYVDQSDEGGRLIIENAGKLVFEIGNIEKDAEDYGQLTAGRLVFRGTDAEDHQVFVQLSEGLSDSEATTVRTSIADLGELNVLDVDKVRAGAGMNGAVNVMMVQVKSESTDGTEKVGEIAVDAQTGTGAAEIDSEMVAMIEKTGVAAVDMPMAPGVTVTPPVQGGGGGGSTPTTPTSTAAASSGSSGGGGGGGAILGLGLLAVLLNSFVGDDDASASFGDYYFNTPQSAYIASINERGVMTIKETGNQPYQMWIRTGHTAQPMQMTGVSNTGVSGTEVGFNLYNSDTFYINTSVAPNVAAEVGSLNLAGKGEVYSLNSGWRNDRYFAGMRLSHGEFEVNSIVDNPIVNSALISNAKLRNTQAQLRAGMNLGTGALRFTPSAAVQVGTYESSEHVADSPALEAAIPSYAQDYTSVQLGLKMTSDKWLSFNNGSKWKPQLKFDSIHTDSKDAGSLTLRQSDKAGALSFNTNAGLRSMPEVVNSMSFGAKVKSSTNDQAEWKFGFAGLEADGEEYYAAMAAYQVRF